MEASEETAVLVRDVNVAWTALEERFAALLGDPTIPDDFGERVEGVATGIGTLRSEFGGAIEAAELPEPPPIEEPNHGGSE